MLLKEVLDKKIPNLRTSQKELDRNNDSFSQDKWRKLGGGLQSRTYNYLPRQTAVKVANITGSDDPTYQFLRVVLKHQDNPYFPKIYSVRKYKLKPTESSRRAINNHKLIITMEKLGKFTSFDIKQLEKTIGVKFGRFFGKSMSDEEASKHLQTKLFRDPQWRLKLRRTTKDAYLRQALRLLEPLFNHYRSDMHFGNIMLRGIGPNKHLVFIDPITQ